MGVPGRFHEGLRVTDEVTMHYVAMALGHVNLLITAALNRRVSRASAFGSGRHDVRVARAR